MLKDRKSKKRARVKVRYPGHMLLKLPEERRVEVEKSYARIANRSLYRRLHPSGTNAAVTDTNNETK